MNLLYIVDARSPIALNWISHFIVGGHEVHIASTFPCSPVEGAAPLDIIPVAMSGNYGAHENERAKSGLARRLIPVTVRTKIRQMIAPWTFPGAARALRRLIKEIQPDLIHAMRIPFEGMVASMAMRGMDDPGGRQKKTPLLISVWGNDFTLHAGSTPGMDSFTRESLLACNALHTDCQRDLRMARDLGFASSKPSIVLPGAGGVRLEVFYPEDYLNQPGERESQVRIINPRGIRTYVRNDTIFRAIPFVLEKYPDAHFLCPGMAAEAQVQKWVAELGVGEKVDLLPAQSQPEMAQLFRQSRISLSITTHDGTPNTLLEAMACGCFPIAGDLESIREWIIPGENGWLVDPGDPRGLAEAIVKVISEPELRRKAGERNLQMVKERGEYNKTMQQAEGFYRSLI